MIRKKKQGFTLIEVLVALVVLSLGLLGIVVLVLKSVKGNDSAYLRTQAVQVAYSMLDSMLANRGQAIAQGYDTNGFTAICPAASAAPATLCDTTTCSASQMSAWDIYKWQQKMCASLPSGQGSIVTVTNGGFTTATITVQWDDSRAQLANNPTTTATTASFVLETSL